MTWSYASTWVKPSASTPSPYARTAPTSPPSSVCGNTTPIRTCDLPLRPSADSGPTTRPSEQPYARRPGSPSRARSVDQLHQLLRREDVVALGRELRDLGLIGCGVDRGKVDLLHAEHGLHGSLAACLVRVVQHL